MTERRPRFPKSLTFFWLLRLNRTAMRTAMVALITGAGAFAASAGGVRALWLTLAGWCLAVGGFSLP